MTMTTKYRFGKNAIIRVAAGKADGTKPAAGDFKVLCLAKEASLARTNGKISIENWCTGGNTQEVPDGTSQGEFSLGETTWTEDDPALQIMELAAENLAGTEHGHNIWIEVLPLGAGTGKPVYDVKAWLEKWMIKVPSKGVITADHTISVYEAPVRGVQP